MATDEEVTKMYAKSYETHTKSYEKAMAEATFAEEAVNTSMSDREYLLRATIDTITQQRNNQYGPPTQDFDRSAKMLSSLGFLHNGEPLQPHHVAMIQIVVKLSRMSWSPEKMDHWLDVAGYAACGWECVENESV